jgi:hypothetical protein
MGAFAHAIISLIAVVEVEPTRLIMDAAFAHLTTALSAAASPAAFDAPGARPDVQTALDGLAAAALTLQWHAHAVGADAEFVARSLAADARRAARYYREGRSEAARYTALALTENCIACHGTLPRTRPFPQGGDFLARLDLARLPAAERVALQITTRQFGDAIKGLEAMIRAGGAEAGDALKDYLRLNLAVNADPLRPLAFFSSWEERPRKVTPWIAALKDLQLTKGLAAAEPLGAARALITGADADALVRLAAADALYARFLRENAWPSPRAAAEAYYGRGVAGQALDHSRWLARADFFFEMAIRSDPGAPFAADAFGRLAADMARWAPEENELLVELRALIASATARNL